jgi:hypothetical protein
MQANETGMSATRQFIKTLRQETLPCIARLRAAALGPDFCYAGRCVADANYAVEHLLCATVALRLFGLAQDAEHIAKIGRPRQEHRSFARVAFEGFGEHRPRNRQRRDRLAPGISRVQTPPKHSRVVLFDEAEVIAFIESARGARQRPSD